MNIDDLDNKPIGDQSGKSNTRIPIVDFSKYTPITVKDKQNNTTILYLDNKFLNNNNKQSKMKNYIGVKMIAAMAMTLGEYNNIRGWNVPDEENPNTEGYLVEYLGQGNPNHPDYANYISWSPKEVFEEANFPIEDTTRITLTDVESFLVPNEGIRMGEKTTVVMDTTITGFDMVATSPCVDPANYDQSIGDIYARKKNVDILWGHLGFVLQWAKNGLKAKSNS